MTNAFRNVIERGGVVKGLYWDKPLDRSALKVLDQAASGSGNKFLFVSKSANGLLTNGPKSVLTEETWLDEWDVLPFLGVARR